jgi:hypothetical protein
MPKRLQVVGATPFEKKLRYPVESGARSKAAVGSVGAGAARLAPALIVLEAAGGFGITVAIGGTP